MGKKLTKAQRGGAKPLYVTDPNDLRLAAYNDSLWMYYKNLETPPMHNPHTYRDLSGGEPHLLHPYSTKLKTISYPGKYLVPRLETDFSTNQPFYESPTIRNTQNNSPYFRKGIPANKPIKYEQRESRWKPWYNAFTGSGYYLPWQDRRDDEVQTGVPFARFKKPVRPVYYKKPNSNTVDRTAQNIIHKLKRDPNLVDTITGEIERIPQPPKKNPELDIVNMPTRALKQVDINLPEAQIIPQNFNQDKKGAIRTAVQKSQWVQDPRTGTWHEVVRPMMGTEAYNVNTGSYQDGGYIEIDADDDEIQNYIAQGYRVEELPQAQTGKVVKPYRRTYDPLLDIKPQVAESTKPKNLPAQPKLDVKKAVAEKQAVRKATAQKVKAQPTLSKEQKAEILMSPEKLDEYTYLVDQKGPDTVKQVEPQSTGSRLWEYATNPLTALEYSIATGDFRNMPHNINQMRMVGIDPSARPGANLVGDALNSNFNLLDAGDKIVRNVGAGNYLNAGLEGLRFLPGAGLETGLGSKLSKFIRPVETAEDLGSTAFRLKDPLTLHDIKMNEILKGRHLNVADSPRMAYSFYDPGDLNLTIGTEAHNAFETMRILAADAQQPLMKINPLDGTKYVRDEVNRIWRPIDDTDLSNLSARELAEYGLDESAMAFKPAIKREVPLTAENENLIKNLETAKEKAAASGQTALVDAYDAKIKEIRQSTLKEFTEPYSGNKAMSTVTLNASEPSEIEKLMAKLKKAEQAAEDKKLKGEELLANPNREEHEVISNAIEQKRSEIAERWASKEGQKRLQNMIDETPELKDFDVKSSDYIKLIKNMSSGNLDYLNKLTEADNIVSEMNKLDSLNEQNLISQEDYLNKMDSLKYRLDMKGQEAYDIKNTLKKNNAAMVGTHDTEALDEIESFLLSKTPATDFKLKIGEGHSPQDLKALIEHEIGHLLQRSFTATNLDKELKHLDLIDDDLFTNAERYVDDASEPIFKKGVPGSVGKAKRYFTTGSKGKEKLTFLLEARQDMVDQGIIKNVYDQVSPEMIKDYYIKYMKGTLPVSNERRVRLFDIIKNKDQNFKLISKVMNKAPMLIPAVGVGIGVAQSGE